MSEFITLDVASSILGVCKKTLRRWDDSSKLIAKRDSNGYRKYCISDILQHTAKDKARPFLKWVGGKSQLLHEILPKLPNSFDDYLEPFIGGGALFFALQPSHAKLNDSNYELINAYKQVRDNPSLLLASLEIHSLKHSLEYFYEIRSLDVNKMNDVDRAARLIYLNKTCYNGLYRVNKKGEFNVPAGQYKNPKIYDIDNIEACSLALRNTELFCCDYSDFLKKHTKKNSFIYLDPPYIPVSDFSDFDRYTEKKFKIGEQQKLSMLFTTLAEKGANLLLSNSANPLSEYFYADHKINIVEANRYINSVGNRRGKINEVLIESVQSVEKKFPSTRYMGSKTSLLPYLTEILKGKSGTILDAFSGSGVVSYHFKKLGFEVISNDFLKYSSSITKALVENNEILLEPDDIDLLLKKNRKAKDFVRTTFKDLYFSDENNIFLDNTLANISELTCEYKRSLAKSALSRACLKRRPRGIFTYVGFKYDDGRKDLSYTLREHFIFAIHDFNKAVFDNKKNNKSYNESALELKTDKPDIVYLDPPYYSKFSDNDYVRRYHFIEGLCRNWEGIEIQVHTKTKKFKKYPSPFDTKVKTYSAFNELFYKYKDSDIILSYSSNSLPTKEEIIDMLESNGKTVNVIEIDYKYSFGNQANNVDNNNNDVKEYIFYASNK